MGVPCDKQREDITNKEMLQLIQNFRLKKMLQLEKNR